MSCSWLILNPMHRAKKRRTPTSTDDRQSDIGTARKTILSGAATWRTWFCTNPSKHTCHAECMNFDYTATLPGRHYFCCPNIRNPSHECTGYCVVRWQPSDSLILCRVSHKKDPDCLFAQLPSELIDWITFLWSTRSSFS